MTTIIVAILTIVGSKVARKRAPNQLRGCILDGGEGVHHLSGLTPNLVHDLCAARARAFSLIGGKAGSPGGTWIKEVMVIFWGRVPGGDRYTEDL